MPSDFQMRLRKRLADMKLSHRKASIAAGLSPDTVGKMLKEGAGPPRSGSLGGLARALDTTEQWLLTGDDITPTRSRDDIGEFDRTAGEVEIKAVAAGSYEGAFQLFDTTIGYAPLPSGLRQYGGVYAIIVINESMVPEHKPGAIRFATPSRKPVTGDSVIVEFVRDPDVGPEAMIAHLLKNGPIVRLGKLNPAGELAVPAGSITRMDRIAPEAEVNARASQAGVRYG